MSEAGKRPEMPHGWGRVPYAYADRLPWMNLPFPVEEYHERLRRLGRLMARDGLDCVAVLGNRANGANVRYLTNFEDFYGGETIAVIPAAGAPGLATNAIMHGEPMHSGIQDCWMEDVRCAAAPRTVTGTATAVGLFDHVEDLIRERGVDGGAIGVVGEIGVDRLLQFLTGKFPRARITQASGLLTEMRAIKSAREIEVMRKAVRLADAGRSPLPRDSMIHFYVNVQDSGQAAFDEARRFYEAYHMGAFPDDYLRWRLVTGTPEEVVERIGRFIEAGCTLPIIRFASYDPTGQMRRAMTSVIPPLRDYAARVTARRP